MPAATTPFMLDASCFEAPSASISGMRRQLEKLEQTRRELQETAGEAVAANASKLAALEKEVESSNAKLRQQQRAAKGMAKRLPNQGEHEQLARLKSTAGEMRRRRDVMHQSNASAAQRLGLMVAERERLEGELARQDSGGDADLIAAQARVERDLRDAAARLTKAKARKASLQQQCAALRKETVHYDAKYDAMHESLRKERGNATRSFVTRLETAQSQRVAETTCRKCTRAAALEQAQLRGKLLEREEALSSMQASMLEGELERTMLPRCPRMISINFEVL